MYKDHRTGWAQKLEGTSGPIYSMQWSPDGRVLASAGYCQVKLWNAAQGIEIGSLAGHTDFVWGVAWSPDGQMLASAGQDGTVKVWEGASRRLALDLPLGEWAFCVSWSPDGRRLAIGTGAFTEETKVETFSGKAQIWDVETRQLVRQLSVSSFALSIGWSADGRMLSIGQWDGVLTFWDETAEKPVRSLAAVAGRSDVNGLAWSPDGGWLAAAQQDEKVRIWDPESGVILKTLDGHKGWVRGLAWSPDGKILASAGQDGDVHLWSMPEGLPLAVLAGESLPAWSLGWSPDGTMLSMGNGTFGDPQVGGRVLIFKPPFG